MKTFEEWIAKNHPEILDENRLGWAAGLAAGLGGLIGSMDASSAAERPTMTQSAPTQSAPSKMWSKHPFDVKHAVETLKLSPTFISKPEIVYNIMIKRWLQNKLTPAQWSTFNKHYSDDGNGNNEDGSIVRPPACC